MSAPKWIVLDANRFPVSRSSQITADEIRRQLNHGPGVVVIDPDDISTVQRLEESFSELSDNLAYGSEHIDYVNAMAEVLRSLLPTPKLPEQMGLGAVVEDADGDRWVRAASDHQPWFHMTSDGRAAWLAYADIDVAESVSEGVVTP